MTVAGRRRAALVSVAALAASGAAALLMAPDATAATITVCQSASCAYNTIQAGVDAASPGDTVRVAAGTYAESNVVIDKPITVVGAGEGKTIVDGGGGTSSGNRVFDVTPLEATHGTGAITISRLTLQNAPVSASSNTGFGMLAKVNRPTTGITSITINHVQVIGRGAATNDFGIDFASGFTSGAPRPAPSVTVVNSTVSGQGANGILFEDWHAPVAVRNSDLSGGVADTSSAVFGLSETPDSARFTDPYVISGNTFHGSAVGFQTYFAGAGGYDNIRVVNNVMQLASHTPQRGDSGVFLSAHGEPGTEFGTVVVARNTMTGDGVVPGNSYGIQLAGGADDLVATGNDMSGLGHAVALSAENGTSPTAAAVHVNRLFADGSGVENSSAAQVNATRNWWGCNAGPAVSDPACSPVTNTGSGSVDTATWIVASSSLGASPVQTGGTTTLSTDLNHLNTGATVTLPAVFEDLPVTRAAGHGSVTPQSGSLTGGIADVATYTAPDNTACPDPITVTVDGETFASRTVTGGTETLEECALAPSAITVTADDETIDYGQSDPDFTYTVTGGTLSGSATCGVDGPHAAAGTYPITCSGATAGPFDTVTYRAGTLTVRKAPLAVTTPDVHIVRVLLRPATITFDSTVSNAATGTPVTGLAVTFSTSPNLLGPTVSCTAHTNAQGVATCAVDSGFIWLFGAQRDYTVQVADSPDYAARTAFGHVS